MKQPTTQTNNPNAPTAVRSSDGLDDPAWNRSVREEIVTALWLIAGLLAWQDNIKWLAWCLFVKAATDLMCCLFYAIVDSIREIAEKQRSSNDQAET